MALAVLGKPLRKGSPATAVRWTGVSGKPLHKLSPVTGAATYKGGSTNLALILTRASGRS